MVAMTDISPAATWSELYNRFYRRQELFSMPEWNPTPLSACVVAMANNGGPIAVVRDDQKVVQLTGAQSTRSVIRTYTCSGRLLGSFVWDKGKLVSMGWSDADVLLCVDADGTIHRFSPLLRPLVPESFSLGPEAKEEGVQECIIWGTGVAARTFAGQLIAFTSLDEPRPQRLADPLMSGDPLCMVVMEPRHTLSNAVEVLLATQDGSVLVVDAAGIRTQAIRKGPATAMSVSPNGKFVALFLFDGTLLVLNSDLSQQLSEFKSGYSSTPDQLCWCGDDSVVCFWREEGEILMVGPTGHTIMYIVGEDAALASEGDGVRLLTSVSCEFIHRVPDSAVEVFRIGSTTPAAMLYDAMENFDNQSAKADELVRTIGPNRLPAAVDTCVDCACREWDVGLQRQLLRAASYGKAFCPNDGAQGSGPGGGSSKDHPGSGSGSGTGTENADGGADIFDYCGFVFPRDRLREACATLRVLNAVRHYEIGLAVSFNQLQMLGADGLINRLTRLNHHLLALRICEFTKRSSRSVLQHWASERISSPQLHQTSDNELFELLVPRLALGDGVSYAAVAANALSSGRPRLAAMLLDMEPHASEQVPLLIRMGELERAIVKAIESGDTDLVYFTIFRIMAREPSDIVFRLVQSKPLARDLFVSYMQQADSTLLSRFFSDTRNTAGAAELLLEDAFALVPKKNKGGPVALGDASPSARSGRTAAKDLKRDSAREEGLCLQLIDKAADAFSQSPQNAFQAKATEEAGRLLRMQRELEEKRLHKSTFGCSLNETMAALITAGLNKEVQRLRTSASVKQWKMPDRGFYWVKCRALAAARDWQALRQFADERKPPAGFGPFVDVCAEAENAHEAAHYIQKLPDLQLRAQAYVRVGMMAEAAETAAQAKDIDMLIRLKAMVPSGSQVTVLIDRLHAKLTSP